MDTNYFDGVDWDAPSIKPLIFKKLEQIKMIQTLEQLSLNAVPSQKTLLYDGWVIRLSDGVTKRANSINPLFDGENLKLEQKINFCENLYQQHNLPTVYKLTEQAYPSNLDTTLADKGYLLIDKTAIQTYDLTKEINITEPSQNIKIDFQPNFNELWLDNFLQFNQYSTAKKQGFANILQAIALPTVFISILHNDKQIACGVGVLEGGFIGLFDLAVATQYRGQGYGRLLVQQLLTYGKAQGCHTAYLQVVQDNSIARNLYQKIGFVEQYQYWYRIKQI